MVLPGCSEIACLDAILLYITLDFYPKKLLLGRDFGVVNVQMRPEKNKVLIKLCFQSIVLTTHQASDIVKCTSL